MSRSGYPECRIASNRSGRRRCRAPVARRRHLGRRPLDVGTAPTRPKMLHGSDLVLDVVAQTGDEVVDGDVSLGCVVARLLTPTVSFATSSSPTTRMYGSFSTLPFRTRLPSCSTAPTTSTRKPDERRRAATSCAWSAWTSATGRTRTWVGASHAGKAPASARSARRRSARPNPSAPDGSSRVACARHRWRRTRDRNVRAG